MAQTISAQFAQDFLERLHAAVNAHDAAAPLRGREAICRFHHETMLRALPDVRIELIDGPYRELDGTGTSARLRISGTMTGPPAVRPDTDV